MKDRHHYPLLRHNTFGIDAECDRFVEYETVDEAVQTAKDLARPYLILGGGSDLLLTGDYHGTVVHSAITDMASEPDGDGILLRVGSGRSWDGIVEMAVHAGWHGAENLSGIPGEVGASAVQNIGAYGAEVKDLIESVEAVEIGTGRVVTLSNADCRYSYRQSRFKHEWKDRFLITHVTYRFSFTFQPRLDYGNIRAALDGRHIGEPTALQLRDTIIAIRDAKLPDPRHTGNAGSFFMNPIVGKEKWEALQALYPTMPHYVVNADGKPTGYKIPAGWMIEQCGWKGRSLGRAGVHDKQALVLVNRGGATGQEIVTLMQRIQADVKAKFGVDLQPEVNVV